MKQRSAAYPSYTILESLDFSERIYKNYGSNYRATREEIAEALNYSVGSLTQKVSAAVQYSLLDMKSKEGYQVTDLFVKCYRPISDDAKKEALLEAFRNPPLYNDLIQVFEGNILPPLKPLANILLQKHSISEKACDKAAEIFQDNAEMLSALTEDRMLVLDCGAKEIQVEEFEQEEFEDETPETNFSRAPIPFQEGGQNSKKEESTDSGNNNDPNKPIPHNIPLKGKLPAQLLLPSDVSSADFDFIISYIGLIRNQY
ncbi:hypothetical protein [Maribacter sp. 2-571]|uniref:hypothetical protein n=1 Tax=Maribacter sp. 2-571 TaxID=3417569 RepID=UPI003D35464E